MKKALLVFLGIAVIISSLFFFSHRERELFAQSVLFQDDFETTQLTNWQIHQAGGNYAETSPDRSQTGSRSLRLHYTGNDYLSVKHNMPSEQTGIVRAWFFDDMDTSLGTVLVLRDKNDTHRTHIGVNTSVFPNHYYYRLDDTVYNSQITRSQGWHKFEIVSTPKGTYGKIDGLPIACKNKPLCSSEHYIQVNHAQKNFYTIDFVSTWGLASDAYFDNVQVETLWEIPDSISEREYRVVENILASYGATNFTDEAFSGEGSRFIANLATAHALKYRKEETVDDLNRAVNLTQRVANNHSRWKFPFWQSSLTSYNLGLAAWLVWDKLDEPTKHLVRSVILEEADLWANEKQPQSGYIDDSKAEENAWTASFLALAANMFTNDEGATGRDKAAKCFAFHSITRNETYCGVTTRTVYDDFTLDNHGIHGNSDYSLATIELLGAGALTYSKTGRQIPDEFKHHVVELWNNAKGRISPVDYRFTHYDDWGANASAIWQDGALAYLSTVFNQAVNLNYENELSQYEYLINHDYIIYPVGQVTQINEYNPDGSSDSFVFLMNTREAHFPTILLHDTSLSLPPTFTVSPTPTPTPPPSFSLSPGWNQITWPDVSNYTAKSALDDIDNDCSVGTAIAIVSKRRDWWENYVKNYGGRNFGLQNNQNYLINVAKSCNWTP